MQSHFLKDRCGNERAPNQGSGLLSGKGVPHFRGQTMELQVSGARWEMETVVDGERGTPVEMQGRCLAVQWGSPGVLS